MRLKVLLGPSRVHSLPEGQGASLALDPQPSWTGMQAVPAPTGAAEWTEDAVGDQGPPRSRGEGMTGVTRGEL